MEAMISLYGRLVLRRHRTPPLCWHHDWDMVLQRRLVKGTVFPSRLWAAQKHWKKAEVMSNSWAAVNPPRPSVTLMTMVKEGANAPLPLASKRSEMRQQRRTVWQKEVSGWQSPRTDLTGRVTRHPDALIAWKEFSPSRGATATWPAWAWLSQQQMDHLQLAAGPVWLIGVPCLRTGRATHTHLDMREFTARRSLTTGMSTHCHGTSNNREEEISIERMWGLKSTTTPERNGKWHQQNQDRWVLKDGPALHCSSTDEEFIHLVNHLLSYCRGCLWVKGSLNVSSCVYLSITFLVFICFYVEGVHSSVLTKIF